MRVALIDWDNTTHQGYTIYGLADHLLSEGIVSIQLLHKFEQLKAAYAVGQISYYDYTEQTCAAFADQLAGTPLPRYQEAIRSFLPKNERALFPKVDALFEMLHRYDIAVYLVSGAPYDVLNCYRARFGIQGIFGFKLGKANGMLTGNVASNYGINKQSVLRQPWFNRPDNVHLISIGDAIADIPLLNNAIIPIIVGHEQLALRHPAQALRFSDVHWDLEQLESCLARIHSDSIQ
ncbi:phosphoserine phosphatase [Paenibacillus phyllosphaerae]|uniref:Phosphoserine phosphatase n=1 Tax=Paenibacillus phyllosphaerae TaxID=274593 RepID=A0A7W5FS32_9BACL|nr:haloacid dehalogenase-like hydrolase [Paenibacillus phyllosphaerae]MBB3114614.1 phosphoserine phosphatase [Paenibacillus phyllosphaerae]